MRHVLTPHGTLLIPGGETSGPVLAGFDRQLRALLLSRFVGQNLTTLVSSQNHKYLIVLTGLIDAGQITPVIDRTYPAERDNQGHPVCGGRPRPVDLRIGDRIAPRTDEGR